MAIHRLNKIQTTPWEITASGDTWVLGEKGQLLPGENSSLLIGIDGDDATLLEDTTIVVKGQIRTSDEPGTAAVSIAGNNTTIRVADTARLHSQIAIHAENEQGFVKIANAGRLEGHHGIHVFSAQDSAEISNSGVIKAHTAIYALGAGADIGNSGTIKSTDGIVVNKAMADIDAHLAENATHIVNSGKIVATSNAIYTYNVAVDIINTGSITGRVVMGLGDDVFDTRRGTLTGEIYGGAGNDVVTLSSPGNLYIEYSNEGFDTVRINSTYMLGENIEHLTLLGKADHTGIGNSLSNTLTGNKGANALYGLDGSDILNGGKGNDRLFGGAGADIFVFKPGYGRDTIMDFEDGVDLITIQQSGFASFDEFSAAGNVKTVGNDIVLVFSDTDRLVVRDAAVDGTILSNDDFLFS